MFNALMAQAAGGAIGTLANYIIIAIVIVAILYIAQMVISVPPVVVKAIWIVIGVVVAILAIRFLVTLV